MTGTSPVRWFTAALLVLAGSCAPVSHQKGVAARDFSGAERTFAFGYGSVSEWHLTATSVGAIALEGMRGLASIDPDIGLKSADGRITLTSANHVVAEYPAPADQDAKGWARLTVTAAMDARALSEPLRTADVERVYEAVFDAALSKLDLFSRYAGAREAKEHRQSRSGFGGIGIRFEPAQGEMRITEIMPDTPAFAANLKVGDIITHVDGESVAGLDQEILADHMRGRVDSRVTLTVRRGLKPIDVSLGRALIVEQTVFPTLTKDIAEFRITSFNQNTGANLVAELASLRAQSGDHLTGVVLDLRGNPGGLLDQAVAVADVFIASGPLVSTRGRHPRSNQAYEARPGDIGEGLPVVVVMDGKSASAAEIVAAALQDAGRAVVLGTNSYGKGTVQTVVTLPNEGEMTLTWSRFHAPSGYALHHLGVEPSLCTNPKASLDRSEEALATTLGRWRETPIEDSQGRAALRALCPADSRENAAADLAAAKRLLQEPDTMTRILALSNPADLTSLAHRPAQ